MIYSFNSYQNIIMSISIDDSLITNPILNKDLKVQINEDVVEINILNVGKFFNTAKFKDS